MKHGKESSPVERHWSSDGSVARSSVSG